MKPFQSHETIPLSIDSEYVNKAYLYDLNKTPIQAHSHFVELSKTRRQLTQQG
jgi:hypothetical protein